jgi:YidC/Oxa1 family membrane protein insertase
MRDSILYVCLLAVAVLCAGSSVVDAGDASSLTVTTDRRFVAFAAASGDLTELRANGPAGGASALACEFVSDNNPPLLSLAVRDNPELGRRLPSLPYRFARTESKDATIFTFTSDPLDPGVWLEKIYEIPHEGYGLTFRVKVLGERAPEFLQENRLVVELGHGRGFVPPPAAGFAGDLEQVEELCILDGELLVPADDSDVAIEQELAAGDWIGLRNRFWVVAVSPGKGTLVARPGKAVPGDLVRVFPAYAGNEISLRVYAGPISRVTLAGEAPGLSGLLFAERWLPMKWLCYGLLLLLDWLVLVLHSHGLAILGLTLCVKAMMWPLTGLADRWQREVNESKSRMQPLIAAIKAESKGEEQNRRILGAHKEQGIHPMFALKSLLGVLLQLPLLFAAYHMLSANITMSGAGFLWIEDLARPDHLAALPFVLPFFGGHLNLLPFLMTGVTVLSSWKFDDGSLSPVLLKSQRRSLYWMASGFFVLFYTFPAGMVLFWTANNLLAFIKAQAETALRRRRRNAD